MESLRTIGSPRWTAVAGIAVVLLLILVGAGCGGQNITSRQSNVQQQERAGSAEDTCGNGRLDEGEECDDGNDLNGDGCNRRCYVESQGIPSFFDE